MKVLFNEKVGNFNKGEVFNYLQDGSDVVLYKDPKDLAYNGYSQKMSVYNFNRHISLKDASLING